MLTDSYADRKLILQSLLPQAQMCTVPLIKLSRKRITLRYDLGAVGGVLEQAFEHLILIKNDKAACIDIEYKEVLSL